MKSPNASQHYMDYEGNRRLANKIREYRRLKRDAGDKPVIL